MNVIINRWNDFFKRINHVKDHVDAAKTMINSIQILVGIPNVFGDNKRNITVSSLFATVIFCGTFIYVGPFSQVLYLYQVFPDMSESFKAINCISATCVPMSKYLFMWLSRARLRSLFELSREGLSSISDRNSAKKNILDILQRARYVSWLVIANQAFTHLFYLLMPLIFTIFGNNRYLPTTPGEVYGLSPKYESPYYEITFIATCIGTAFSAVNQTGYIILFITLLAHELGHFYVIKDTFIIISNILSIDHGSCDRSEEFFGEKSIDKLLIFCVKHHQFLVHFHCKIQELYKAIFGAHFIMMTIVLVTTLQTFNEWDVRNTILTAVTGVMPLFLYCFGGELLISAGQAMSTSIYMCSWELMENKHAKIVQLMLCVSQHQLHLSAADIFVMNRRTFGNVAQTIYKIYAVFD